MSTIFNVTAASAAASTWALHTQRQADTTGAVAENKKVETLVKPQNAETSGAIAFENGIYSSCQGFQAAA